MKHTSPSIIKQMHEPLYQIVHMHVCLLLHDLLAALLVYNVHIRALLKLTVGINVENACLLVHVRILVQHPSVFTKINE